MKKHKGKTTHTVKEFPHHLTPDRFQSQLGSGAIIDQDGVIMTVNKAWKDFAKANGLTWQRYGIGTNYLEVCDSAKG